VQDALVVSAGAPYSPPATEVVVLLGAAVRQRRRVRLRYRSFNQAESEREVDPYGVVYYGGRWFVAGHCHLRQALRTFRLDRVLAADLCRQTFVRPNDFDALAHVIRSLAESPGTWGVEVLLRLTLAQARERVAPELATLAEVPDGVLLRCNVQNLDWFATVLAGLECDFVVRQPSELGGALRRLAHRLVGQGVSAA
jgi:predicted DNA-binding transcriptional regulator YafY